MITRFFKSTGKKSQGRLIDASFFSKEENEHNCQASNNGVAGVYIRDHIENMRQIGFSISSEDPKMIDFFIRNWINWGYVEEITKQ